MQCPKCGTANPEQAKFCLNCGARLALACAKCETELPPGAKFCFACGAPTGAPPPDPVAEALKRLAPKEYAERLLATRGLPGHERRMVTILFSDIKGSSAIARDLDPEEVLDIVNGAFEFLIPPVFRYEGTLTQLMGDAILAFFGAPIAHDDDPERACRAALDIISGAKKYADKLERERGIRGFNVRVGINTGPVVVGEVGTDLRVAYTAVGDTINMAARMEQAAEPGTVLVTDDTHRLIAPLFETKGLGRIPVKGHEEPMSVYRIMTPKAVGKVRGIAGLTSPMVGRDRELRAVQEAMERLRAGVGGIVTVLGEAGLGKSRLVAEVRKETDTSRFQWVEGRCLSYGTSIAYLLWLDVLRSLLGVTEEVTPPALRERLRDRVGALCPDCAPEVYPYLARLMSLPLETDIEAKLASADGQSLKAKTFDAVERILECAAKQQPLVLVCEDLHWGDSTSIELLERLLALTDRAPVLFLCVMRPERERPSWRIGETGRRLYPHRYVELSLLPLSAADSQVLVSNLLTVEGLPPALKKRILQQAEGNPFYLEEILRSLMDTGAIARDAATGRWRATQDVAEIALPDTLQGILLARIDRLQEDTKRVLQMASVIGRTFLYRVLQAMAEEEQHLDRHLITLQREEMIRERVRIPELEYIFKHYLTQEAAYNGLLKKDRRAYHRQVAEALERLFPERRDELCGFLAYHWERAEVADRAIEYLLKAGDQARVLYAHEEAVGFYERALALLKEQGDTARATRTLMKLGLTYHTAFDYEKSRKAYDEAFELQRKAAAAMAATAATALQTLRLVWRDPPTLDPTFATAAPSCEIISQMFSGLVALSPDLDILPDAARGWDVSQDGRRYVFRLRDDAYWSDGVPVAAGDFEYAWKRVLDPAVRSGNASLLYDVKGARAFNHGEMPDASEVGVRAADDGTLVVELEEPSGYFLHLVGYTAAYPLPRHVIEKHGDAWAKPQNIVSNGPFCLESWEPWRTMTLVRNPHYRGRFGGNVGCVQLTLMSADDWQAVVARYESGDLDAIDRFGVPHSAIEDLGRRRRESRILRVPGLSVEYATFDVTRPPFDDPRVRRAFVLATDRQAIGLEESVSGVSPTTGGFTPPGLPGHFEGIALPFDPERARALLAEAGYPDGRGFPQIDVSVVSVPVNLIISDYLRSQWQQNLGLDIPAEVMQVGEYQRRRREQPPHIGILGWIPDYPDPDSYLRVGLHEDSEWRNERYEVLLQQARRSMDQSERMRLYEQAERILAEEAPILVVGASLETMALQPWVKSFPTSAPKHFYWSDVIIKARPEPAFAPQVERGREVALPSALQTLRLAGRDPPTLDPSLAADVASADIITQMFGGLVALSPELDVLPDLARSWEVSTDGRAYVFVLRDDLRWSDGAPLTALDFEYAWKRVLDPAIASPNANLLHDLKGARAFSRGELTDTSHVGVHATDDRTLLVELEEPAGYFLHLLSHNSTFPLPRHVVERRGSAWTEPQSIVSNGPFRLESREPGRSISLVRNPHYHGVFEGNVGRVYLALMPPEDWQAILARYEAGHFDLVDMGGVPPSRVSDAEHRRPGSRVLRFPRLATFYAVLDVRKPPFDDVRVRQAFLLGTDREAIAAGGLMSGVWPGTGGLTPRGMPGYCDGIAPRYDPDRARRLLAEAGYPDGSAFPGLHCLAISSPAVRAVGSYLQSQWRQNLGVDVSWETMEWGGALEGVLRERPHIYLTCWITDYPDPDSFLRVSMDLNSPWRSEAYELLVEQARHVMSQAERMSLYGQVERILVDEVPIVVAGYGEETILLQPWVARFPVSAAMTCFWKDVVIQPHDEAVPRLEVVGRKEASTSTAPQTLRLPWQDPPTLDPSMTGDSTSGEIVAQMFSGLVVLSRELDILPDMARSWEVSTDGRRYVFHLREDAYWTDGIPVTAEDFEFAWKRVLDPAVDSPNANLLYDVKGARAFHEGQQSDAEHVGVRAADDRTLVVELEEPTGYFFHLLSNFATYPLPRHVVKRHRDAWTDAQNIVSNGPFRLESWEPGRSMTFVRNFAYHAPPSGNVERVQVALMPLKEWQARLARYEAGALDIIDMAGVPPAAGRDVEERHPGSRLLRIPKLTVYGLVLDVTRPPFNDPRVRRALVLGIDREAFVREGLMTGLLPPTGGFTPPGMPGHCEGIAPPYNPDRARQLLAEAGYPDGQGFPTLKCLMVSGPSTQLASGHFQAQWRENLEIEIAWESMEWAELLDAVRREPPHIYLMGWLADYPDPDTFLRVAVYGASAWRSERYDELVERARRSMDQGERMRLYAQAEKILADEVPIMLVGYSESTVMVQPWVTRFPISPAAEFYWKDVVIEPH